MSDPELFLSQPGVEVPQGWSLVDTATTRGLFRAWYEELKGFDAGPPRRGPLPHLGIGAGVVTMMVSSFFVGHLAEALAVIVAYGWRAYFRGGLRIVDWKHDVLSSGARLSFVGKLVEVIATLLIMAVAVCGADFFSMAIKRAIQRKGLWVGTAIQSVGGVTLLAFALCLYRQGGWELHPIPLSALIGGAMLIWKAFRAILQETDVNQKAN